MKNGRKISQLNAISYNIARRNEKKALEGIKANGFEGLCDNLLAVKRYKNARTFNKFVVKKFENPMGYLREQAKKEVKEGGSRKNYIVKYYVDTLIDTIEDFTKWSGGGTFDDIARMNRTEFDAILLNGADSWTQYSWDGNALIYDEDIMELFHCCYRPDLLDLQAEYLARACKYIHRAMGIAR